MIGKTNTYRQEKRRKALWVLFFTAFVALGATLVAPVADVVTPEVPEMVDYPADPSPIFPLFPDQLDRPTPAVPVVDPYPLELLAAYRSKSATIQLLIKRQAWLFDQHDSPRRRRLLLAKNQDIVKEVRPLFL